MKSSIKKRLQNLESTLKVNQKPKCALIICDPDIMYTFDFSFIEAEHLLILPDNGHRITGDPAVQKNPYSVYYP